MIPSAARCTSNNCALRASSQRLNSASQRSKTSFRRYDCETVTGAGVWRYGGVGVSGTSERWGAGRGLGVGAGRGLGVADEAAPLS